MIFEQKSAVDNIAEAIGYSVSYLIFTTMLYLITALIMKHHWTYLEILFTTLAIVITSKLLQRIIK